MAFCACCNEEVDENDVIEGTANAEVDGGACLEESDVAGFDDAAAEDEDDDDDGAAEDENNDDVDDDCALHPALELSILSKFLSAVTSPSIL